MASTSLCGHICVAGLVRERAPPLMSKPTISLKCFTGYFAPGILSVTSDYSNGENGRATTQVLFKRKDEQRDSSAAAAAAGDFD